MKLTRITGLYSQKQEENQSFPNTEGMEGK